MKNLETKEKTWKEFLGSAKLSNIIAAISVVVSIISLFIANTAMQKISINVNAGMSAEDVGYVSEEKDDKMMDKAYEFNDILKTVDENPNLHFSLVWSGTKEEAENINWKEMPPYITKYVY